MTKKFTDKWITAAAKIILALIIAPVLFCIFSTAGVYGAIWDTFVISVEQPHGGHFMYFPNVSANYDESEVKVDTAAWVKTESDVQKELAYYAGESSEMDFDMYDPDDRFKPGETYYGIAIVHLTGTGGDAATTDVGFTETDYIKQIGSMARDTKNGNVLFAFSATVPAITVTVEFGEGHEAAAAKAAESLARDRAVAEGSTLTYLWEKGTEMWDSVLMPVRTVVDDICDDDGKLRDNGELLVEYSIVNIRPMEDYPDYNSWEQDFSNRIETDAPQESDVTIYMQWLKPADVSLKIEAPVCGTEVTITDNGDGTYTVSYMPEVTLISGNATLDKSDLSLVDVQYENWFSGTVEGGSTYGVWVHLDPFFGYYMNDDDLVIDGGTMVKTALPGVTDYIIIAVEAVHDYGEWTVTAAPTCSAEGERQRVCAANPEHVEKEVLPIDADAHEWGEWEVETPATCEEEGVMIRTCMLNSSHTETAEIPALGHEWGEWKVTRAATCEKTGIKTRTCKRDPSHTESVVIPALGHKWGEWKVIKEPTGTKAGQKQRVCENNAAHVQTMTIPAKGETKPTPTVTKTPAAETKPAGTGTKSRVTSPETADNASADSAVILMVLAGLVLASAAAIHRKRCR